MKEKCKKFESLFIFRTEEELLSHLNECDDCKLEYEKFQKVSNLLKEVRPYYMKKRKNYEKIQVACMVIFIALSGLTFTMLGMNTDITDTLKYGTILSSEDLGLPVDSYGLIAVE